MKRQVVKVVCSKDLKFIHIDAGMSDVGVQRISTETNEEAVIHHYLQPAVDEQVRQEFPELKNAALTINFTFV
mgnify:FL=1|jgi:hypothetical protein